MREPFSRRIRDGRDLVAVIQDERIRQEKTWADLEEKTGIARGSVIRWEGSKMGPYLSCVIEELRALGMELVAMPSARLVALTRAEHERIHSLARR